MRFLIASLVLLSGCSLDVSIPDIPGPSITPTTPSGKCHILLDAICVQSERCTQSYGAMTPKEYRWACMEHMQGRAPMNGTKKDSSRDQCDAVRYISKAYEPCLEGIQSTCTIPEVCEDLWVKDRR